MPIYFFAPLQGHLITNVRHSVTGGDVLDQAVPWERLRAHHTQTAGADKLICAIPAQISLFAPNARANKPSAEQDICDLHP